MTREYEALVYDLDGTLVHLDVDWDVVGTEIASALRARGVDVDTTSVWELLERSEDAGHWEAAEEILVRHERDGARSSRRLALADELPASVPVGVCSLNCEASARIALELHGLDSHVGAIVGRDTVSTRKPDPEPLLEAIRGLGAEPTQSLFIGDSESDAITAERAGVDFQYVSDRQRV
ncbi:HAD family hydrolase [Halovenus marina]|uniref:HAD family hydrolase n=1 Tax=Halovenus marina TaxID=3396621 RepID=UPI003F579439